MLAYTAAFLSSDTSSQRMEYHSRRACHELEKKKHRTTDESDLFAACLLAFLYGISGDDAKFRFQLHRFMTIMREVVKKAAESRTRTHLSIFWPLARDLLLDASRRLCGSTSLVLEFCRVSRQAMQPQGFCGRQNYATELFGTVSKEFAFAESIWHNSGVLTKCFRVAVSKQIVGETKRDATLDSALSEVKADINSRGSREIVERLKTLRVMPEAESDEQDAVRFEGLMFTLLLHQFCQLLIVLLEGETVVYAASSSEGADSCTSLLELIRKLWLSPGPSTSFSHTYITHLLPRLLWIAGLGLPRDRYPECKCSHLIDITMLIIHSQCREGLSLNFKEPGTKI
jgi:hypothetical protein